MARLVVGLVSFAVLAAILAAPVPKFNPLTEPVLAPESLAKLPFVNADRTDDSGEYPKSGTVGLAVYLPKTEYRFGEPVLALFAVKNRTDHRLGLDMGLDLSGRHPAEFNSCAIDLRSKETDKPIDLVRLRTIRCGAGGMTSVPKGGHYAVRGNVATSADGEPLPVGEYELRWRYGWAESNAVAFTVRPSHQKPAKAFRHTRIVRVSEEDDGDEPKKAVEAPTTDAPLVWAKPGVRVDPTDLLHALGTGEFGRHYPNVRDLPTADGGLGATAKWDGDKVTVRVEATNRDEKPVVGRPAVYLMIECDDVDSESERQAQERAVRAAADGRTAPFALTLHLPDDWKRRSGAAGDGRVAVLLTSREPAGHGREEEVRRRKGERDWVLRTDWQPMTFPPVTKEKE